MATEPFNLKVWKCHPSAGNVLQAERSLNGLAHPGGLQFCGPYTYANRSGYWLFPPIDIDICWKGNKEFDVRFHQQYDDSDYHLLRSLILPADDVNPDKWCMEGGRSKFTWGMVEDGVIQMWTGNIFETPPGWALHVRSPVNFPPRSCYVMEGILETDWMQQDIWTNIVFTRPNEWVEFRKDGWPPLAQLIPTRREGFAEKWEVASEMINRDTPEANRVFEYWIQFNEKKFGKGGKQALTSDMKHTKDSTTFYKEKARICAGAMEPKPEAIAPGRCPFHKPTSRAVVYCINDDAKYRRMFLNSVKMLRGHNATIPVKLIYIDGSHDLAESLKPYDVEILNRPAYRPEAKYFSINKWYLKDVVEDSVLYLDVDTFVNGDVGVFFDRYRTDFTAVESSWAYGKGWNLDFLPNKGLPYNSGVQLFQGGYHRKMFSLLPEAFDRLSTHDTPLAEWSWDYYDGCLREEIACSLILAESGGSYMKFTPQDVYNIQRVEDIPRCHEPVIFHSYTNQWDMVKKWCSSARKMVWKRQGISGKNE